MLHKRLIAAIKRAGCIIKAIPLFLRCGCWVPHVYAETGTRKGVRIAATESSFRIADDLRHSPDEELCEDCTVVEMRCIHCGKETKGWYRR